MDTKKTYKKYKEFIHSTAQNMYNTKMRMRRAVAESNVAEYKRMIALSSEITNIMRTVPEQVAPMDTYQLQELLKIKELSKEIKDLCCQIYTDFGDRINIIQCLIVAYSMQQDRYWEADNIPDVKSDLIKHMRSSDITEVH